MRSRFLLALVIVIVSAVSGAHAQTAEVTVQGTISSSNGRPLEADLTIVEGSPHVRVSNRRSDSRGHFSFQAGVGRNLVLVAKADGYISSEQTVLVSPGISATRLNFVLAPAGTVSGRVIGETGKGVAGATVRVRYPAERRSYRLGQEMGETRTDDFGYFSLPFVARGRSFVVDATAPHGGIASSAPMILPGESMTGIIVTMNGRGQMVRGTVLDRFGQPVANANITLRFLGRNRSDRVDDDQVLALILQANQRTTTARDGSFELHGIPEGTVVIVASHARFKPSKTEGTVTPGQPLEVRLTLQ